MWYEHIFHHMHLQIGEMEACDKEGLDASAPTKMMSTAT